MAGIKLQYLKITLVYIAIVQFYIKKMITIKNICDWGQTKPNNRNFLESERLLKAGHIIKCGKNKTQSDDSVVSLTAYCVQNSNMKENRHQIDARISTNNGIIAVKCSCKAGLGEKCKHMLATVLHLNRVAVNDLEEFSCTDVSCKWKDVFKEKISSYTNVTALLEHDCFREQKQSKLVFNSNISHIESKILMKLPFSSFSKQEAGRHNSFVQPTSNLCIDAEALKLIFILQTSKVMEVIKGLEVNALHQCCLDNYSNLQGDSLKICINLLKCYSYWLNERQYRITGTKAYGLFTYINNKKPNWEKKVNAFLEEKSFKSTYTEYGKKAESEAREVFRIITNLSVLQTGLIISNQNPWLAVSPDGVIFYQSKPAALLEIKCPFNGETKSVIKAMSH